ncbi:hypothetical protein [Lysobacter gummosus]|uniref:hypothetical protein n=1 Tax=Lysobacter gummosus TaxID=262324 RepID=UPI003636F2CB
MGARASPSIARSPGKTEHWPMVGTIFPCSGMCFLCPRRQCRARGCRRRSRPSATKIWTGDTTATSSRLDFRFCR